MNFYLVTAFNFSILMPGILAAILFKEMDKRYYPFIVCLWIGCFNEVLSLWLIHIKMQTLVNSNIYVLVEALLLLSYFRSAGMIKQGKKFYFVLALIMLCWIAENFIFGSILLNSTYFRIFASLLIVGLSLQFVGEIIFNTRQNILKNADFILCACFIVYFSFKALIQSFVIYGSTRNIYFLMKIYNIMLYINLGVNLLYILAVLWMPRKVKFILQSS